MPYEGNQGAEFEIFEIPLTGRPVVDTNTTPILIPHNRGASAKVGGYRPCVGQLATTAAVVQTKAYVKAK
jgi:hypothetical protein